MLNDGTTPPFIEKSVYEGQTYHNGIAGAANNPSISSTFLAQWLLVLTTPRDASTQQSLFRN
jgi:hypothetical protein